MYEKVKEAIIQLQKAMETEGVAPTKLLMVLKCDGLTLCRMIC